MSREDVVIDPHLQAQYSEGDHHLIINALTWKLIENFIKLLVYGQTTMSTPWQWMLRRKVRADFVYETPFPSVSLSGVEWWIKKYVVRRAIPPRKLLLAFGLIFVRASIRSSLEVDIFYLRLFFWKSKEMPEPDNEKALKILKMTLLRM